ncbi:SLC13 family permease [Streptomyces sp. NPDC048385]|uniref:SLC13 family permease n=1 Tax=Streptomyces sp. NPDC048385 TaxID=3155145 RepID=UPI00342136E1
MTYLISLLALAALFAIGTATPVNMGVLAFAAAFTIGPLLSGMSLDEIVGSFPANIFVVIVGITLLFGIARTNGTVDLIVTGLLKLVRGRRWAIVWLMFVLGAVLMSLGAVLAVGMLAPIAMPIARKHKIDPLLMGMMISHGVLGAAFSPINLYGAFINGWLDDAGLHADSLALFLIPLGLNFLIALALFLLRGRHLLHEDTTDGQVDEDKDSRPAGSSTGAAAAGTRGGTAAGTGGATTLAAPLTGATAPMRAADAQGEKPGFTPIRVLTLVGLVGLLLSAALYDLDVGISSMVIAAVLLIVAPRRHKEAMNNITWSAVLLVCGMLTYMSVLEANGTLKYLGDAAAGLGSPYLTAFVLCLAVAAISAIGSSIGTLGIVLPLAAPILSQGDLGTTALIAALAFCTVVVDVSPFSSNGVMVLVNAQVDDREAFQRRLLRYCGAIVAVAPLLATAFVLVTTVL